jgi:two-component sensor histidine kinase
LNAPVSSRLRLSLAHSSFMRDTDLRRRFNPHSPADALSWLNGIESRREEWAPKSASLADLVGQQLGPYVDRRESQVSVEGPAVLLKPDAAQNLGFALHELASNAAKYGALSVPEGRVSIAWRLLPEADGNGVELDWVESGGPAVVKPAHRGFGSMVIERNLARELDTKVELAFRAEGVQCKILLPPGQLVAIS